MAKLVLKLGSRGQVWAEAEACHCRESRMCEWRQGHPDAGLLAGSDEHRRGIYRARILRAI
jgi:hypothetical protein